MNKSTQCDFFPRSLRWLLHFLTGGGASDNLDQFSGNGGLALTVVQNLEPARC